MVSCGLSNKYPKILDKNLQEIAFGLFWHFNIFVQECQNCQSEFEKFFILFR